MWCFGGRVMLGWRCSPFLAGVWPLMVLTLCGDTRCRVGIAGYWAGSAHPSGFQSSPRLTSRRRFNTAARVDKAIRLRSTPR